METPEKKRRRRSGHSHTASNQKKAPKETLTARINRYAILILAFLIVLAGFGGAFLLGRSVGVPSAKQKEDSNKKEVARRANDDEIGIIDRAFVLINQDKLDEAKQLLADLPELPFGDFLRARISDRKGDEIDAVKLYESSVAKNEASLESMLALARILGGSMADLEIGDQYYKDAIQLQPFDSLPFYSYGESLRSRGVFGEAVKNLEAALQRSVGDPEYPIIETKHVLARLESGDKTIVEVLRAVEDEESPSVSLLIGASALAVREGDLPRAAALMERARTSLSEAMFGYLISDRLFDIGRSEPEFARFFRLSDKQTSRAFRPGLPKDSKPAQ